MTYEIRRANIGDIEGFIALQRLCFPPPFPEDLLWQSKHIETHIDLFPEGQFVAVAHRAIVASASNMIISEENWQAHDSSVKTVGGPFLANHDATGSTLYGLDISVSPSCRNKGIGRALYQARFDLVMQHGLVRYGTGCRIPDYSNWQSICGGSPLDFATEVMSSRATDRTLTPLLRYGLTLVGVSEQFLEDPESNNAAAILEWRP